MLSVHCFRFLSLKSDVKCVCARGGKTVLLFFPKYKKTAIVKMDCLWVKCRQERVSTCVFDQSHFVLLCTFALRVVVVIL